MRFGADNDITLTQRILFVYKQAQPKNIDKNEDLETEKWLNKRFQIARDGDNLMGTPFE